MPTPPPANLLIISPVKDEAEYLEQTIASVAAQTRRPARWVIVNDGSSDRTGEIADAAAREHAWITVLHRPAGTARRVGPGVVEAFYAGLATQDASVFDYICKLDGDLEFAPTYFADLLERFAANPRLGTISGKCFVPVGGRLVAERTGDGFSHGVAKLYRRACFEAIGGFVREVMWDGIDCHRCRQFGWVMGSSQKSVYHGRVRWGRGQYFMGTHPLYALGIACDRMAERPWVIGGACILWGYAKAWATGHPRFEAPGFRRHLHRWQLRELAGLMRLRFKPPASKPRDGGPWACAPDTSRDTVAGGAA